MENKDILIWLQEVEHPAKGDKNIVELGMIENIEVNGSTVAVTLGFAKHRPFS
jgi:metal-sulfur cluster biosynthetic enzyme